jgi:hypothetical protein
MNEVYLKTASDLFEHISENAEYFRQKMLKTTTSEGQWYKYTDRDNNSQEISFAGNRSANVELSLKIKGRWVPWVYVNDSTIENGGKGLFSSRKFKLGDTVTYFMGRKLSIEELNNKKYSKYAMENVDPCDKKGRKSHWYYLSHLINHGNYLVANLQFEPNLVAHCIKPLGQHMEFFVDYQRPIFCKKCHEHRKESGVIKWKRVETKNLARGTMGKCCKCKSTKIKVIVKECKKCHKKLCIDCYDYFQKSI